MISLQVLNKIIITGDNNIVLANGLTEEHFVGYENEFQFIQSHYHQYGNVPDRATFISKFEDFELLDVGETDDYLVSTLNEEYLYYKSVEVLQHTAKLIQTDSRDAVDYLHSKLPELQIMGPAKGIDIINGAVERYNVYVEKLSGDKHYYIPTGFQELDNLVHGWARGEELVVLFARTGQGKSWILVKTAQHAWEIGYNVGYISPEMSPVKIGYRFDTLHKNFSNSNLVRGNKEDGYAAYINELTGRSNKFVVATPKDFNRKVTVSKLKQFVKQNNLDMLCVDGITYLHDERAQRGDNKTTRLTNISEDLMELSIELDIPIVIVVQSNRQGAVNDDEDTTSSPDLENIKDSDGIAHNATKVFSLRQTGAGLLISVKKHRDGEDGGNLTYYWDIDRGKFEYIPSGRDSNPPEQREQRTTQIRESFDDGTEVF